MNLFSLQNNWSIKGSEGGIVLLDSNDSFLLSTPTCLHFHRFFHSHYLKRKSNIRIIKEHCNYRLKKRMNNFMNKTLLLVLLLQNGVNSVNSFSFKPTSTAAARQKKTQISDSFIEDPILADMPSLEQIQQKISFTPPSKQKSKKGINRQSSKDWLHNIASIPRSTVLQEILSPVLTITAWSTLISVVHRTFQMSQIQSMNKIAMNMCISTSMHSFLVSSLGLLLVFRTNSAYQRFVGECIFMNQCGLELSM